MPAPRKITIAKIPTTGTYKIEVVVSYDKGGYNYWNGNNEPRGYYMHVTPVEYDDDGWKRYAMFSGLRRFLSGSKRFSAKRLEAVAKEAGVLVDETVSMVCEKEGLTLAA